MYSDIDIADLLDKMRTFCLMWGPHSEFTGPNSFENINFRDLLDKMRTFSHIWGSYSEFPGLTSFALNTDFYSRTISSKYLVVVVFLPLTFNHSICGLLRACVRGLP